jgi:hypothetical protein
MKKLFIAFVLAAISISAFASKPKNETIVNGSAFVQSVTVTNDMVAVNDAVRCNQEAYQLDGILQGLAGGMSKKAVAKLIKDTPPETADTKALLRDLDLVTSDPHFMTADPSIVLGFVFKTCLLASMQ